MLSQGVGLIILTLLAKIAGFLRDLVLSYFYGASNIVDAYVVATTIPMVVFSFVGTGIETSLIPMLSKIEKDGKDTDAFLSNIINFFAAFCIIAIIVVNVVPVPVVKLFASGFDDETLSIAVSFTRFSITGIVFSTLTYLYSGILHYKNKFIVAAFSTILMDGVVLLFVILSSVFGYWLLPIGNVTAFVCQAVFLRFFIRHKHRFSINFHDTYLREMIVIILPVVVGVSVNQVNLLIDQTLASRITVGGIAYLNYANKVLGVVQGVFILSFISLLFPRMAELLRKDEVNTLYGDVKKWAILLEFFLIPCTVLFAIYSYDIIKLLFERGQFNSSDTNYTGLILLCYAIELPFYGLREIFSRVYYTFKNTKLPMINAMWGLLINIIVSIGLSIKFGLVGLAIGTTVSCISTCAFITTAFLRDHISEGKRAYIFSIVKWSSFFLAVSLLLTIIVNTILPGIGYWFIAKIVLVLFIYSAVCGIVMIKNRIIDINSVKAIKKQQ